MSNFSFIFCIFSEKNMHIQFLNRCKFSCDVMQPCCNQFTMYVKSGSYAEDHLTCFDNWLLCSAIESSIIW